MSYHKIELFGHIVYSPDLSYHDLLSREVEAKITVQAVLESVGGDYIHFEALGDTLRFQCMLLEERESLFHTICDGLAPYAVAGLDARLLFVDKDLGSLYIYSLSGGKWLEGAIIIPPAGWFVAVSDPVPPKAALRPTRVKSPKAGK